MAVKQQHKTDELTTNDMKLIRNCDSGEENHKHNSKIPTETGPPLKSPPSTRGPQSKILTSDMALNRGVYFLIIG